MNNSFYIFKTLFRLNKILTKYIFQDVCGEYVDGDSDMKKAHDQCKAR
jgi:hypothetical protein